jgi:hypothetical protein
MQFDAVFNFGRRSKIERLKLKTVCFQLKSYQPLIYDRMTDIDYYVLQRTAIIITRPIWQDDGFPLILKL